MIRISEKDGFKSLPTKSTSSKVFFKDGKIFKINNRNSLNRQRSDFRKLKMKLREHELFIPKTKITECIYKGEKYTCVIQPYIKGKEIKYFNKKTINKILIIPENIKFLNTLLEYFFTAVESFQLYPDIVGYPKNPNFFNSINLIVEDDSGKILLCDVGLSPHEDTLKKHGKDFYSSGNVRTYLDEMLKFKKYLS